MSVPSEVIAAAESYARQPRNALTVYEQQQQDIRDKSRAERERDAKNLTYRCPTCGYTFQADGINASCPMGPHEGSPGRWPINYF